MTIDEYERRNNKGDSAPAVDTAPAANDSVPKFEAYQGNANNNSNNNGWNDWQNNNQGGNDSAWDTPSSGDDYSSDYDYGNDNQRDQNESQQAAAQPQPQNEAERAAAAQAQNQYTQQALANVTGQQNTLEQEMKTVNVNDEAAMWALYQKYYDANGNPRQQTAAPSQQQQQPQGQAQAPFTAQQTTGQTNNGKRQILDPNNDYGRTGVHGAKKDSYVYSYSAKQLQNQLNREIMQYNRDIASGKRPGTAADYIKPLKEDGLMGYNTIMALQKLGYDTTPVKGWTTYDNTPQQTAQPKTGADYLTDAALGRTTTPTRNQNTATQAFYDSVNNANGYVNGVPAQVNDAYMKQFQNQYESLHRQYPNYTFEALANVIMATEQRENGNSAYYNWIAGQM